MVNRRHGRLRVLVLVVVILGLAGSVAAQEDSPDFWGLGTNFHFVSAVEFRSISPETTSWRRYQDGFWNLNGSGSVCEAEMRLPTGSLVTGMTVIYVDDDADSGRNIRISLQRQWVTALGAVGETQVGPTFESSGAPGLMATWVDIDPDQTIMYIDGSTAQSYILRIQTYSTQDLRLRGVIIGWNRQVSPAPVTATFNDVPTDHWAFQFIEALAASGITGGCGGGNYCPDNPITRGEMAVFLSAALGLHWAP